MKIGMQVGSQMSGGRLLSLLPKTVWQSLYESNGTHASIVLLKNSGLLVVLLLNATSVVFLTGSRFLVHACF